MDEWVDERARPASSGLSLLLVPTTGMTIPFSYVERGPRHAACFQWVGLGAVTRRGGWEGQSGDGNQERDRKPDSSTREQTTQTPPESRVQNNVGKAGRTPTALPSTARS